MMLTSQRRRHVWWQLQGNRTDCVGRHSRDHGHSPEPPWTTQWPQTWLPITRYFGDQQGAEIPLQRLGFNLMDNSRVIIVILALLSCHLSYIHPAEWIPVDTDQRNISNINKQWLLQSITYRNTLESQGAKDGLELSRGQTVKLTDWSTRSAFTSNQSPTSSSCSLTLLTSDIIKGQKSSSPCYCCRKRHLSYSPRATS